MNILGLGFVVLFAGLMLGLAFAQNRVQSFHLRDVPAFSRLSDGIGLAVEAGRRLHQSLGYGGITGVPGASTILGLSVLQRVARSAAVSDFPPIATSGEAAQAILAQDILRSAAQVTNADIRFDPADSLLTGVTPLSYTAGALEVVYDQKAAVNIFTGSFGSEIGLLADAATRTGSTALGGSESVPAQAVLFAALPDALIGEELFAAGAYLQAGPLHRTSLLAQDIFRWLLILALLGGAALKLVGVW